MLWALAGKLLLAASKIKCLVSHSPGSGTCCGCTWHSASEEGDCCGDVWYVGDYPCPSGTVYLRWGENDACCGCLPEQIFDPRVGDLVNTKDVKADLCCPFPSPAIWQNLLPFDANADFVGCIMRCCKDGACTDRHAVECVNDGGQNHNGFCAGLGCPADCCSEDHDGNVTCETIDGGLLCVAPRVLADPDCATGCKGQCCTEDENGIYQPQGMMTQADCEAMNGKWAGLGKEDCNQCPCRDPFSCSCCETKTSTAAGLVFTQPRKKRHPPFADTFRVVVTGSTESAILVHGIPVGAGCDFEVEFVLCWDQFNIEPVPCDTNFKKLDVKVCWFEQHTATETLNFSGCNGLTINLGDCQHDCITTLVYDQTYNRSSDATIYTRNDATLRVEHGTIEFTGNIVAVAAQKDGSPCANSPRTLTLSGAVGKVSGVIGNLPGSSDSVDVTITDGEWWLGGANTYRGRLRLLGGTAVIAASVDGSYGVSGSPFGLTPGTGSYPLIGAAAGGAPAVFLFADGVTISRAFTVAALGTGSSQAVVVGGRGSGTSSVASSVTVTLERDVTLQAGTGGTVTFSNGWATSGIDPTFTIGSSGNSGTVVIDKYLPGTFNDYGGTTTAVNVVYGTAKLSSLADNTIDPPTPVTVGSSLGTATLDINGRSQMLSALTLSGSSGHVSNGTLVLGYDSDPYYGTSAGAVNVSGTGHQISADVTVGNSTTIITSSSATLTISGAMGGGSALTFDGSGTVTLSAAGTRTGTTTISGGTVNCGDDDAFGTGGITVATGGTLNLNGHTIPNTITNTGGTVNP